MRHTGHNDPDSVIDSLVRRNSESLMPALQADSSDEHHQPAESAEEQSACLSMTKANAVDVAIRGDVRRGGGDGRRCGQHTRLQRNFDRAACT